jgi:uncharacterized membrane protein
MISRWQWLLTLFGRQLWLRVSVLALIGVATAAFGIVLAPWFPDAWAFKIGADALDDILNILASSMLAVTVFSVSTMVAAYSAATNNVTPRATKLLMEDKTPQNVLGTLVGSFLFSLVAIIALSTGLYGAQGRAILFIVTICLVALISVTILRWIDYLAGFGRLGETMQKVEVATWKAMKTRLEHPYLGGRPTGSDTPEAAWPVFATEIGYVQHVDCAALEECASTDGREIFVAALPGVFADPARPVAFVSGLEDEAIAKSVAEAFSVGAQRTFDQDPRFGLCVLAEIASRALSPAVNDPGTAIEVIGRAVRLLSHWGDFDTSQAATEVEFPRVRVTAIDAGDLLDDVFAPIERDGAGLVEVQARLQKAFLALLRAEHCDMRDAARRHSTLAATRAEAGLDQQEEKQTVRSLALRVSRESRGG